MKHPGGRPRKQLTTDTLPHTDKPYYTVSEAAAMTGTHIHTIQARLRDGTLKGKKLGGIWKIYPSSLLQNDPYVKVDGDLTIETNAKK